MRGTPATMDTTWRQQPQQETTKQHRVYIFETVSSWLNSRHRAHCNCRLSVSQEQCSWQINFSHWSRDEGHVGFFPPQNLCGAFSSLALSALVVEGLSSLPLSEGAVRFTSFGQVALPPGFPIVGDFFSSSSFFLLFNAGGKESPCMKARYWSLEHAVWSYLCSFLVANHKLEHLWNVLWFKDLFQLCKLSFKFTNLSS